MQAIILCVDHFQAFKKSWEEACSSTKGAVLVVPQNNYLLKPIRFSGPCKSSITVEVRLIKYIFKFEERGS